MGEWDFRVTLMPVEGGEAGKGERDGLLLPKIAAAEWGRSGAEWNGCGSDLVLIWGGGVCVCGGGSMARSVPIWVVWRITWDKLGLHHYLMYQCST